MLFIVVAGLLAVCHVGLAQHPTCDTYTLETPPAIPLLVNQFPVRGCFSGGYDLPKNFNVSALPVVQSLVMTGGVVNKDFTPFPPSRRLRVLIINHFNEKPEHMRFPFNKLFENVKSQITSVLLNRVKLLDLTAADFSGFNELQRCYLVGNQLATVSGNIFEDLIRLSRGVMPVPVRMLTFSITSNPEIKQLDWSLFKPVSSTIQEIYFSENYLWSEQLFATKPFTLDNATKIFLSGNRLQFVPATVYATFNPKLALEIHLEGNRFCKKETETNATDCGCCELAPFARWLRNSKQTAAVKDVNCAGEENEVFPGDAPYKGCRV